MTTTQKLDLLSKRQRQVIALLCAGRSTAEAAQTLRISKSTVGKHRETIYRKLHIHSLTQLTHFALETKIVPNLFADR